MAPTAKPSSRPQRKPSAVAVDISGELSARKNSELYGLLYIFSSVTLLVFFILKPSESHMLGAVYGFLATCKGVVGVTMYLFSFLLWYFGIQKFMHGAIVGKRIEWLGYVLLLVFSNLFFEVLNDSGGTLGRSFEGSIVGMAGNAGAFLAAIFGMLVGISLAFDILLAPIFTNWFEILTAIIKYVVFAAAFAVTYAFKLVLIAAGFVVSLFRRRPREEKVDETDVRTAEMLIRRMNGEASAPTVGEELAKLRSGEEVRTGEEPRQSAAEAIDSAPAAATGLPARDITLDPAGAEAVRNIRESLAARNIPVVSEKIPEAGENAATSRAAEEGISSNDEAPERPSAQKGDTGDLRAALSRIRITKTYGDDFKAAPAPGRKAEDEPAEEPAPAGRRPAEEEAPYAFPDFAKILEPPEKVDEISEEELKQNAEKLVTTFKNFNIDVQIVHITQGPTVTRYEIQPAKGVKVSKIVSLSDDIALSLATSSIRIEAPIPGKAAIGLEVPNSKPVPVYFADLITLPEFKNSRSPLLFALGKTITGQPIIADLKNMPHLLVAGTTGSGKSVCINTIIASMLFHARPDEVKFVMVDPKMVELIGYNDIPHLIHPVVTKVKDVPFVLEWGVYEMERRYQLLSAFGVRSLDSFNSLVADINSGAYVPNAKERSALAECGIEELEKLPYLVFLIDELADLMMTDKSNKIEDYICRLAQMARAVGMHLVVATQRPSVDVITGLIKANLPSRIAFAVSSSTDSRTILDCKGAEKLIGRGDMLYSPTGLPKPVRVQGAYVRDKEIKRLTDYLKENFGPSYNGDVEEKISEYKSSKDGGAADSVDLPDEQGDDDLFYEAVRLVIENKMGSASMLQRMLKIGHNRALRLIDQMERMGVVGPFEDKKPRKVLWTLDDLDRNVA